MCEWVVKTIDAFGRIDILVNNAAINPVFGPIEDVDPAIFDKIMEVNVKAPWQLSNLVLPHLQQHKNGSIINIGLLYRSVQFILAEEGVRNPILRLLYKLYFN